MLSSGLIRRPVLILQNENGIYDRIAIYKNKKNTEPLAVIHNDEYLSDYIDDAVKKDTPVKANRDMRDFIKKSSIISVFLHRLPLWAAAIRSF